MKYLYFDETAERIKVFNTKEIMIGNLAEAAPLGQESEHYYFELPDSVEIDVASLDCLDNASIINMLEDHGHSTKVLPAFLFDINIPVTNPAEYRGHRTELVSLAADLLARSFDDQGQTDPIDVMQQQMSDLTGWDEFTDEYIKYRETDAATDALSNSKAVELVVMLVIFLSYEDKCSRYSLLEAAKWVIEANY